MFNEFCCPKCGDIFFNRIDWETFIEAKGILKNRAFLQFTCCDNGERMEIGNDFDWRRWAEFEDFKHKIKISFWQELGDKLLGDE